MCVQKYPLKPKHACLSLSAHGDDGPYLQLLRGDDECIVQWSKGGRGRRLQYTADMHIRAWTYIKYARM